MRNVARLPSHPPTPTPIHLSSGHPLELWGIHSFKCWSQDWDAWLTIFRIKEWDAGIYFGAGLVGPDSSHTLLHMFCCWKKDISENQNKQNNGVRIDICAADVFIVKRAGYELMLSSNPPPWLKQHDFSYIRLFWFILAGGLSTGTFTP